MADEKFDQSIESLDDILKKIDKNIDENKTIDDLLASSDNEPTKSWSMDSIDKLISDVEDKVDFDELSGNLDLDKIQSNPGNQSDIYFSKDSAPIHRNTIEDIPMEFEDISSTSEDFKKNFTIQFEDDSDADESFDDIEESNVEDEVMKYFDDVSDDSSHIGSPEITKDDIALIEADESELKRQSEEFQELNEEQLVEFSEHQDEEFGHGDYLKVKDIFKNSKILSKRREQRANAKTNAMENIKEKFGKDVFFPKKKKTAEDFSEFVDKAEENVSYENSNVRFDMETGEHYVVKNDQIEETKKFEDEKTKVIENIGPNTTADNDNSTKDFNLKDDSQIKRTDIGDFNNAYVDERNSEVNENQLRMEGYDAQESLADHVSEEEIESDLLFSSNERRKRFKLTNIPEDYNDIDTNYFSAEKGKYDDEQLVRLSDENDTSKFSDVVKGILRNKKEKYLEEYTSKNEIPQVFKDLKDKRKSYAMSFVALLILEIFSVIFTSYPIAQQFTGSVAIASVINIILTVIVLLLAFSSCSQFTQNGLKGLLSRKINSDSLVSLAVLSTLVYSLVSFFNLNEVNVTIPIFTPIVIFVMMMYCFSKFIQQLNIMGNLKVITRIDKSNLYSVEKITNKDDAQILARSFAGEHPNVCYSCEIDFPGRYLYNSTANHPADKFSKSRTVFLLVLSLIISIISAITNQSAVAFFATLTSCICICVPVSMLLSNDFSLKIVNKALNKKNSCITGYNAIYDASKTDAVIINSADLFDKEKCNFHGMHEYGTIRVDDIVLYAAAMLTKSNGPLSHVFDKVIIGGDSDMLPEVDDLLYEEKLGLSGWIHGQKILVGNRNLLIHHNLEAPPKSEEINITRDGNRVLYVAVDSHVAAMLVVSYKPNNDVKKYLQKLNNNATKIIVSTNDCNIDEDVLSLAFNIPRESFKIIGDFEGGISSQYTNIHKRVASAKLIHSGESMSYIRCISNAVTLGSMKKIFNLSQISMVLIGLLIILILSCVGNIMAIGSGFVVIYHLVTLAILLLLSFIKFKVI